MPARRGSTIGRALEAESHCPGSGPTATADKLQTKGGQAAEGSALELAAYECALLARCAGNAKANAANFTLTSLQTAHLWFPMPDGPALSSGAAKESQNPEQLKRKIVVGLLERPGEIFEVGAASTGSCCLGAGGCRRAAAAAVLAVEVAALRAPTTAQHR